MNNQMFLRELLKEVNDQLDDTKFNHDEVNQKIQKIKDILNDTQERTQTLINELLSKILELAQENQKLQDEQLKMKEEFSKELIQKKEDNKVSDFLIEKARSIKKTNLPFFNINQKSN